MIERRSAGIVGAVGVTLLALTGCHQPVTEVVVVVDTDLSLPAEADTLELDVTTQSLDHAYVYGAGHAATTAGASALPTFPATLGLVPADALDASFSVTASLAIAPAAGAARQVVVTRKVSDVRFVSGERRMLFISLLRECACASGSCSGVATSSACLNVTNPILLPFDPAHLPQLPSTDGGVPADASDGGAMEVGDAPADRPTEARVEAGMDAVADASAERPDAGTPPDATSDIGASDTKPDATPDARDAAVEMPPTLYPRGHACAANAECQDNFCVDSVCCQSACKCGTCGGGAPGTCMPATAGTDPHNACGAFTCNGAGACTTTCPEAFSACSSSCASGSHCDGQGACVVSTTGAGLFCIVGSCLCKAGLSCVQPDAGGAGQCQ
jgi:hypothetical protein